MHALLRARSFAIEIVCLDASIGRSAGELIGRTGTRDATIDALIVATAHAAQAFAILTSDPDDMIVLAEGRMRVIAI